MGPIRREVNLAVEIKAPPSKVFAAICDLPGYNSWLSHSDVFRGTTEVSDYPVKLGTKYVEHSPSGTRHGEVVELDETERHVVFHQPHLLKPTFLGVAVDVTVDMTVKDKGEGVALLERQVRLGVPLALGVAVERIASIFERESLRTMQRLQVYLEENEH